MQKTLFYILEEDWGILPTEEHVGKLVSPPRDERVDFVSRLHRGEDVSQGYPPFVFSLIPDYQPPDCILNTIGLPIYSERLLLILKEEGVTFKSIEVEFVTRFAKRALDMEYFLFNFTGIIPSIDRERSTLKVGKVNMVLLNDFVQSNFAMMYSASCQYCIINQRLADRLLRENVTGFMMTEVSAFR